MPAKTRTSESRGGGRSKVGTAKGSRSRRGRVNAKAISGNPFTALATGIKRDVDARLQTLLDERVSAAKTVGSEFVEIVSAVRDLCLRGGKRLRPALLIAGYRAASARADLEPAVNAGVALELLQAYFLIHDDWMDGDTERRGGPAVHALLGKRFRSTALGDRSGILAGDYSAALAAEAMATLDVPPVRLQRVFAAFSQMQLDVVAGQQLDLVGRTKDIEQVYTLKTSAYTVSGPLKIGAMLAGGSARTLATLDRWARPIGIAFQLRDDLLGAFGDKQQTGKPIGSDLRAAKRTVLLATALRRARGRDHRILKSVVGNARASEERVKQAIDVLERCGARRAVEARIDELVTEARVALEDGRLSPSGRALLEGAAHVLTARVK